MTTVFIAGSIAISRLHRLVVDRIAKAVTADLDIVVGDADGADTSIQECLKQLDAKRVTVFCSGMKPRNNVGEWPIKSVEATGAPGSRAFFTAKDLEMASVADYGLMVWDSKSTGTLSNVIELLKHKRKSVVFVNKIKDFITVADVASLEGLLDLMSENARFKAEDKISLSSKIRGLSQQQLALTL